MASRDELVAADEKVAAQTRGATLIGEISGRGQVKVSGVLQALTYQPASRSASLRGSLYDGTGTISLVWVGRRDVPGIKVGIHLVVNGMVAVTEEGLTIMNPDYQILTEGGDD